MLRRSNNITVEVNPAIHGVNRRVAGLFAVDDKTDHTVLLHRGRIGGGKKGIGKSSFIEWYPGTKVEFIDPSHDYGEESAILVADLDSERFLIQLEDFVDAVHRFKIVAQGRRPDEDVGYRTYKKGRHSSDEAEILHDGRRSLRKEPIRSWNMAKRRAAGKCELCRMSAPFTNASNEPYLESHHIVWLAHGGPDSIENTVALCPNCHRKMHVVNDAKDVGKLKRRTGTALGG